MGKKETMASFPETVRATVRGYRLWHQYAPQMLPSIVLYSAFSRARFTNPRNAWLL